MLAKIVSEKDPDSVFQTVYEFDIWRCLNESPNCQGLTMYKTSGSFAV